jgi:CBS domain-containing protein
MTQAPRRFAGCSFSFLPRRSLSEALGLKGEFDLTLVPVVSGDFRLVDVITIGELLRAAKLS